MAHMCKGQLPPSGEWAKHLRGFLKRLTETARHTLQETSDFILESWNSHVKEEFIEQLDYRNSQL